MEELTKQQIVLVTLLVSFVTSIATGIVTVSLMEQAPPGVTQTFNQVVERTIERVVTEEPQNNAASAGTMVKETVVVTFEDQAVKAIDKNINSVVKIKERHEGQASGTFIGLGVIASKDGLVLTDKNTMSWGATYSAVFYDGTELPLTPITLPRNTEKNVKSEIEDMAAFKLVFKEGETLPHFSIITFADDRTLKLGQSVVALSGFDHLSVVSGMVQSLERETREGTTTPEVAFSRIVTNIDSTLAGGSPLVNLSGDVIGLKLLTRQQTKQAEYIPNDKLKKYLELITAGQNLI